MVQELMNTWLKHGEKTQNELVLTRDEINRLKQIISQPIEKDKIIQISGKKLYDILTIYRKNVYY
jgi:hypothetical protein